MEEPPGRAAGRSLLTAMCRSAAGVHPALQCWMVVRPGLVVELPIEVAAVKDQLERHVDRVTAAEPAQRIEPPNSPIAVGSLGSCRCGSPQ